MFFFLTGLQPQKENPVYKKQKTKTDNNSETKTITENKSQSHENI